MPTFREWLKSPQEAPAAENLATVIARAGPAGVSLEGLSRALGLPPEDFRDILGALTATGQVEVLQVNGRLVYRAAG
jgi:DNA-binding IclR family transcriptional regulator